MTYRVRPVLDRTRMRDFINLPYAIYGRDPCWIPPLANEVRRTLDPNANPYFRTSALKLFVCYRNEIPVARTAVIINPAYEKPAGTKAAFFGFFESTSDLEAALALFGEAERFGRQYGATWIEGPVSPNYYSELGLQLDHFDSLPTFFQPHNPPYYEDLLVQAGYREFCRLHTRKNDDIAGTLGGRSDRAPQAWTMDGYMVRPFRPGRLREELERLREVNNDAFAANWRFCPLTHEEYLFSAKFLKYVTRPGLIQFVERDGEAVAALHCVLDINPLLKRLGGRVSPLGYARFLRDRRSIDRLVIFSVAIKKAHQHTAAFPLLWRAFREVCRKFRAVETTWMTDGNTAAINAAERLGMRRDREFAIYGKEIRG